MPDPQRDRDVANALVLPQIPGYECVKKLGAGGMGVVYLARQVSMGRDVALKVLSPRLASDPQYTERFYREARMVAKLNHPNVITAYDVSQHEGMPYLVMEYVEGPTVRQLLQERGRLEEREVIDIGLGVARALEAAYRVGIVHRDVKPHNIMLTRDGIVKLCDLGLAREVDGSTGVQERAIGTAYYMAPEQARGEADLDVRTDLYALGATLYHLATGQLPFMGETREQIMTKHVTEPLVPPKRRRADLGERLSRIITKLMQKERAERVQTPSELIEALQPLADEYRRGAAKTSSRGRIRHVTVRRPLVARRGTGPVVLLVLVILGLVILLLRDRFTILFAPPVGVEGEQPRETDSAAKTQLDEILALQQKDAALECISDVLRLYDGYRGRHSGTAWEARALQERSKYVEAVEHQARLEVEALRRKEGTLRTEEKWRDLIMLYRSFPTKFLEITEAGREVKEEMARCLAKATEKLAADRARLLQLGRARRYAEALALVRHMEGYAPESALPELAQLRDAFQKDWDGQQSAAAQEVADKYLAQEVRWREDLARREYRLAIGSIVRFLTEDRWTEEQRSQIHIANADYAVLKTSVEEAEAALQRGDVPRALTLWDAVLQLCEACVGDPASPAEANTAQRVLLDLRNAVALELLRHQVLSGLDRYVRAREPLKLESYGGMLGCFEVRESQVVFIGEGKSAITLDPQRDLVEPDWITLATRALDDDGSGAARQAQESAPFLLRAGLLLTYARSGMGYVDRAYAYLVKAVERGARGARIYLVDLLELARKKDEQAFVELWARVQERATRGDWSAVREACENLLREKGEWVVQHKEEIERFLAKAEAALVAERELGKAYHAKVERLNDGRLCVKYDFDEKAQSEAFEALSLPSRGRWAMERGGFESSKLTSALLWKHRIRGDVTVEYALTVLEDPPQNIVTTLYYNPGSDRHYSATLAFDLVWGSADPKNTLEDKMSIPRVCVLKYPLAFDRAKASSAAEWEFVRRRVIGTAKAALVVRSGAAYRVRLAREGKALRWWVDERLIWEAEDEEYIEGQLLFFSDSRVRIDDLAVTFKP